VSDGVSGKGWVESWVDAVDEWGMWELLESVWVYGCMGEGCEDMVYHQRPAFEGARELYNTEVTSQEKLPDNSIFK
jgi:hypothetical protein